MDKSLYQRPDKPKTIPVNQRARDFALGTIEPPKLLAVHASTECHVTPPKIGVNMADYLDLQKGKSLLEPQCGTGNLIQAALDYESDLIVTGVEKNVDIYRACQQRFKDKNISLVNECFFEFSKNCQTRFDYILTNPPFKNVKAHIESTLTLLAPDGVLVALVPITFNHRDAEELETLARGDFNCSNVLTKLIRFCK
jgi:phospholipid N-methyltransferase